MSILDITFYAFIVIVFIQVLFYLLIFRFFAFFKPKKQRPTNPPVSVIVCAKNEASNLEQFLPLIISQDYPNFEIVLINASSTDSTLEVMKHFKEQHSNIKIVNVENTEAFWANKKYALTLGIKASKYEHLLLTDADCKPVSKNWIKEMSGLFNPQKTIVLGYGKYFKIEKSFLNKLIRFETLITAIQYFSYAKIGIPYMGVGRNLAYTKQEFFKVNGFVKHIKVHSGDDDLFISEIATNKNVAICISKDGFTESIPKQNLKEWINQKKRHISSSKYYKWNHKALLSLFYISNLLFWVLSLSLLISNYSYQFVWALFIIRLIIQFVIVRASSKKLNETDLLLWIPLLEISLVFMQLIIFINNLTSKTNYWK